MLSAAVRDAHCDAAEGRVANEGHGEATVERGHSYTTTAGGVRARAAAVDVLDEAPLLGRRHLHAAVG